MHKMLRQSWDLTYVYITDGRHGSDVIPPGRLVKLRREEGDRERRLLGIRHRIELGVEDGSLAKLPAADWTRMKSRLATILGENETDIILVPTASDMHPDHRAAHKMVVEALEGIEPRPLVVKYFVWLLPDFYQKERDAVDQILMVGIDNEMPVKINAIRTHQSQLSRVAFDSMALMLDGYLGYVFRSHERIGSRYVEIVGISGGDFRRGELDELENALQPFMNITEVSHGRLSQNIRLR
jgi:LmbE family N-acetylglucosaminyl deacetylase